MKKKLLLITSLFSIGLCFSQTYGSYEIDTNGKIFYQLPNAIPSVPQENNIGPMALALDWSNPDFDVSNNPTKDSWDSRMAVGNTGNVYVVYSDNYTNGLQKIMFRKKVVGENWSTPIFVDKGGEIGGKNNHFGAITSSPNGDLHVIYNVWANENVRNYIGYSYYNAATDIWSDGLKISDLGGTVNHSISHHDLYSTEDNLPVVVWGYDNRENQVDEEVYMKYFDGTNWSSDIAVSDLTDNLGAGFPYIKSIGNNKAMLVYAEGTGGSMEIHYKIYDETTHTLSAAKVVTTANVLSSSYVLTTSPTGEVMVLTIRKAVGPSRDVLNVYDYDSGSDSFSLSSNVFEVAANAGGLLKRIDWDCNAEGDCAVIYTDFLAQTNSFLEYNPTTGFGSPLVINEENPGLDAPNARFDPNGNLHVVWSDFRFNDGQGFDEREIIYEKGVNTNLGINAPSPTSISVFPNPSNGTFTIDTNETFTLEIFDVLGKKLDTKIITSTTQINSNLASGTYFLRFTNAQATQVRKLLVE
ncbi:T9SS type A sorting domain-containing protein [Aequorivita lipolytica]|uniref:T9SS type A sorting domain-containing protein n=1 Tax=Aequorivita lipolytica TaxID=153267 RepID=A0A5C6YPJ0_9FLAO|nr:T9SS type A sorting domain-containing protein [Aequorivita lipolytica]TXD68975.1 T9SS type A sorting domain-containing protein [Aequorivita lipolytica]SRX53025.1 hypothetical protein AEQU2_02275 [Aequorivita lipolytica]